MALIVSPFSTLWLFAAVPRTAHGLRWGLDTTTRVRVVVAPRPRRRPRREGGGGGGWCRWGGFCSAGVGQGIAWDGRRVSLALECAPEPSSSS
eukprot:scaffold148701_cov31-Tisochrysis_lutea.AAC.1